MDIKETDVCLSISGGLNDSFAHIFTMSADATLPVVFARKKDIDSFTSNVIWPVSLQNEEEMPLISFQTMEFMFS